MSVESTHFYTPIWIYHSYTHKQQVRIPSLGTYYNGLRVPDLLLTALYRLDRKTGTLAQTVKLIFQTDGPSAARLNFKLDALTGDYKDQVYQFNVAMDVVFGKGVVLKSSRGGETVDAEKVTKGGPDGSVEVDEEVPVAQTFLRARIEGTLRAKEKKLEAWGHIL